MERGLDGMLPWPKGEINRVWKNLKPLKASCNVQPVDRTAGPIRNGQKGTPGMQLEQASGIGT
jgi:hypothetical protein